MNRFDLIAFGILLAVGTGCVTARKPLEPVVSPTGIVYPLLEPPRDTRFSQVARTYMNQGRYDRVVEHAREGIAADPENAMHYFMAGVAYTHLGDYEEADRMFIEAKRLYPPYEIEIEIERERSWADAFNKGLEAYAAGRLEETVEQWRKATFIYDLRPEAHRNLATLLAEMGQYDDAIEVFRQAIATVDRRPVTRVLSDEEIRAREQSARQMRDNLVELLLLVNRYAEAETLLREILAEDSSQIDVKTQLATALSGQGRDREAAEIYIGLLDETDLTAAHLFKIGVSLFRTGDFTEASEAFRKLTELQPDSRDAWFNYTNSLFAAEDWPALARAADRLVSLDPLSETAALIAARAHLEAGDEQTALQYMERIDAAPVHIATIQLRPSAAETRVQGRVVGNGAEEGNPVRLMFTFYEDSRRVGSETVTITAPAPGETAPFEVTFPNRASAYRYEVLP